MCWNGSAAFWPASTPWAPAGRLSTGVHVDIATFAQEPMDWLLAHQMIPLDVQGAWQKACAAIDLIAGYAALARAGGQNPLKPASSGCMATATPATSCGRPPTCPAAARTLWTWTTRAGPGGARLVDAAVWRPGPAQNQLGQLVDGYEQFREFDRAELALIEPLRTLRLIHYSAWLARRWDDPAFPAAFPWFGSSDYWQGQVQMLEEQIEAMQEPALVV
jgi:hypothetical protein